MSLTKFNAFEVISDSVRREILENLKEESMPIHSLVEKFTISRPAISKHLKILEESGFISYNKLGRERYCKLSEQGFRELDAWIRKFEYFWKNKLENLEELINKEDL